MRLVKEAIVLNLARPTEGDTSFYSRWTVIGEVLSYIPQNQATREKVEVLVIDQYFPVDLAFIKLFPNLKIVASATTGHSHLDFDWGGYKVITLRGEKEFLNSITSVAEFTIMQMLRLSKLWSDPPLKMAGRRVGIIGPGRIGSKVATICEAMGMKVWSWDKGDSLDYLKTLFQGCDFISIHLEENKETKGLISKELIDSMPKRAFFINTARASLVDETALYNAVEDERIAGAALDTTKLRMPYYMKPNLNLLISGHIAGRSLEDRISTDEFLLWKVKKEL